MAWSVQEPTDATADPSRRQLLSRLEAVEAGVVAAARGRLDSRSGIDDLGGLLVGRADVERVLAGSKAGSLAVVPGADADPDLRLNRLSASFGLDAVDVDLLVVALAPDVVRGISTLYAFLQDDPRERYATVELALELCGLDSRDPSARARLRPGGALVDGGLLVVADEDRPFLGRSLTVPDRVTMHLLGDDRPDPAVRGAQVWCPPLLAGDPAVLARALRRGVTLAYLRERPGASGRSLAAAAAAELGTEAMAVDLGRLRPGADVSFVVRAGLLEARLRQAVLVVGPVDEVRNPAGDVVAVVEERHWPVVLTGSLPWDPAWAVRPAFVVDVPAASSRVRRQAWRALLGDDCGECVDPGAAVASFRLSPEQIDRAAAAAWLQASVYERAVTGDDVRGAARSLNTGTLDRLAHRIEPQARFDDLLVPEETLDRLLDLCGRARWRDQVLDDWGLRRLSPRGDGISALFAGPPGTGKTLAAEVLAGELGLDLYVVDLSTVVDKYVGETEKNLDRIFSEAERTNAVLLFDEADALFGKRSQVNDARDRYANVEVSYLLQRMERFSGTAILTSNLQSNVDDAFLRRLDGVVNFPMPDAGLRRAMWDHCLGAGVPRTDDVDLDFCAWSFELSGGHIRNAVITAAFLAVEEQRPVSMRDLISAIGREYTKLGRICSEAEFGPYHEWVSRR